MAKNEIIEEFTLKSGSKSRLLKIRNDIIPNYYLLCFPKDLGQPSHEDVTEMLNIGVSYAQKMALEHLGDKKHLVFFIVATALAVKKGGMCILFCWEIVGGNLGYISS